MHIRGKEKLYVKGGGGIYFMYISGSVRFLNPGRRNTNTVTLQTPRSSQITVCDR